MNGRASIEIAKDAIAASNLDVLKVESLDGRCLYWNEKGDPETLCARIDKLAKQLTGPFMIKACKDRQIGQKGKRGFNEVALSWPVDARREAMNVEQIGQGMNGLPSWAMEELIQARVDRQLREYEDAQDDDEDEDDDEGDGGIKGITDLVHEIAGAFSGKKAEPKLEVVKDDVPVAGAQPDRVPFTKDEAAELLVLLGRARKTDPDKYTLYMNMIRSQYGQKQRSA